MTTPAESPDAGMEESGRAVLKEVSNFRLYLMRFLYLLNLVGLGSAVWPGLIRHPGQWDPLQAVAVCFWAALSVLMGFGIRYPLKMTPLLLLQFFYKSVWLIAIGITLHRAGRTTDLMKPFIIGVVLELIIIPWPYVLKTYVEARGDRWR